MTLLFAFPEQAPLVASLAGTADYQPGEWMWRHFPDRESYVRIISEVRSRDTAILCSLNHPDEKFLPLVFLARTLKECGASKVTLIAPYLGYMRQDKAFQEGEAVTSEILANLLSDCIDELVTIDPHLHRHARMEEIYSCKCRTLSAASLISRWISSNIDTPLIVGPDSESEQWVKVIAGEVGAPHVVADKLREGDRDVRVKLPDLEKYKTYSPVLIDDVISTAATMVKTVRLLRSSLNGNITCIATHAVFADNAYENLLATGARIITTNTIPHQTNAVDIIPLLRK